MSIDFFFEPKSVAVIGASRKPGKIGHEVLKNLLEGGFPGDIYPVNPKADEILGLRCYRSIKELPPTDLAVICIPANAVISAVEECGERGVKGAIVISAGFSEIGRRDLEEKLVRTARKYNLRIIGPNCAGIMYTPSRLFASFEMRCSHGNIAFLTQSGALGAAVLAWLEEEQMGLCAFVSYGNQCDVDEAELLEYFAEDDHTKAVAMYVEGIKSGRRFIEKGRRLSRRKPLCVLKGGISEAGAKAVASHTGSLAGSYAIYRAVARKAGALWVWDVEELFDASVALANLPLPKGRKLAIVTNSGGPGVLLADKAQEIGYSLPPPPQELVKELRFLPEIASLSNPFDLTAQATADDYALTLEAILNSKFYDAVAVICVPPLFLDSLEVAKKLEIHFKNPEIPVLSCWMSGSLIREALRWLRSRGVVCYPRLWRTANALRALFNRAKMLGIIN